MTGQGTTTHHQAQEGTTMSMDSRQYFTGRDGFEYCQSCALLEDDCECCSDCGRRRCECDLED